MQGSGAFLCLWEGESGASAHGEAGIGEPVGQDSLGVLAAHRQQLVHREGGGCLLYTSIFTLRSSAPLDKGLCARLLASLQPDYEGFELKIDNLFGYATLDEAALRELMEEMKRDGIPINGFLDRCRITITGQNITVGVCHGTKFLQEMEFERLLADRVAAHTGVRPKVTLTSAVGEAEQRQMEEKLERKIAPPVVKRCV